jgi:hypothetical protein
MKKLLAALAVLVLTSSAALALIVTNETKIKNAKLDQMNAGLAVAWPASTNIANNRARWQAYFDIVTSNEAHRIYRDQLQRERNAIIAAAVTSVVEDVTGPVGD